jgi:hypothetical protein
MGQTDMDVLVVVLSLNDAAVQLRCNGSPGHTERQGVYTMYGMRHPPSVCACQSGPEN